MGQGNRIDSATRRYELRTGLAMALFAVIMVVLFPRPSESSLGLAIGLMSLCSLPLVFVAYEYQRYVRALDELQGRLELQAVAIGAGIVLLSAAVWGFGEKFDVFPDLSPIFLLPAALVVQAIVRRVQGRFYE